MSVSASRFTIAKLDAGMAILLTSDHHLIEFPSLLLPTGVVAGSIIDLNVSQNLAREKEEAASFKALQEDIRNLFATHKPSTPELSVKNTTQTSVVLEWNLLDLATADMVSLSLYKNGSQLGKIPNATTITTKLSGLALDTDYLFQLILKTTAGVFKSNVLKIRTHKMTNLTGLNVCVSNIRPEEKERVNAILSRIGAKPAHDKVRIDTTHFVTDRGMGDEFKKAQNMNIPIVVPEFVEACEAEGRLMRAGSYYLDADPSLRSKRVASTPISTSAPNPTNADGTPLPSVSSVLPTQTTPIDDDAKEPEPSTAANISSRAPETSIVASVTDTVKDLAQKGTESIQNAAVQVLGTNQAEVQETAVAPAQDEPAVAASETGNGDRVEDVEPHPEAARAVESHPAQIERDAVKAGDTGFPPSMGRSAAALDEMEDVAL